MNKEQIIYIDDKPHIECGLVMLESKQSSNIQLLMNGKLHYENNKSVSLRAYQHHYITSDEEIKKGDWFLTNQNGHWELQKCQKVCEDGMIMSFEEEIAMFQEDTYFVFKPENCRKIIATTDTSLGLPQPSQAFIEKYIEEYNKNNKVEYICKNCNEKYPYQPVFCGDCGCRFSTETFIINRSNIITEVLVKVLIENEPTQDGNWSKYSDIKLKVDSQNQITLKKN